MAETKKEITKKSNIADLIFAYPELQETFMAFGLHCATCFASQFDTIEDGARIHGMMNEEIEEMIEELKKVVNKQVDG